MTQKSNPPLSDAYRKAWESCAALWPLFLLRLAFVFLNFGALAFCLFLTFWPLIQDLMRNFQSSGASSFQKFVQTMDPREYMQFIPGLNGILFAIGLGLLYILWWSLLAALFDGAVYSRMREYQKNGTLFSLSGFFKDGLGYMFPMIGLQASWLVIFIGVFLAGTLLSLIAVFLLHLLHIPWWVGILLAIPGGFAALGAMVGLGAVAVMAGAYLMEGKGVFHALKEAFQKCFEAYGRVVWGFFLVWIIYFVFSVAFQSVMGILSVIPFIGLLFLLFEIIVSVFFSIAIWVYMPSLAVFFSLEKEA